MAEGIISQGVDCGGRLRGLHRTDGGLHRPLRAGRRGTAAVRRVQRLGGLRARPAPSLGRPPCLLRKEARRNSCQSAMPCQATPRAAAAAASRPSSRSARRRASLARSLPCVATAASRSAQTCLPLGGGGSNGSFLPVPPAIAVLSLRPSRRVPCKGRGQVRAVAAVAAAPRRSGAPASADAPPAAPSRPARRRWPLRQDGRRRVHRGARRFARCGGVSRAAAAACTRAARLGAAMAFAGVPARSAWRGARDAPWLPSGHLGRRLQLAHGGHRRRLALIVLQLERAPRRMDPQSGSPRTSSASPTPRGAAFGARLERRQPPRIASSARGAHLRSGDHGMRLDEHPVLVDVDEPRAIR